VTRNEEPTQVVSEPAISSDKQQAPLPERSISHAWRALRHRNFQLFFTGQSISLIGTWMTRLATTWLVYVVDAVTDRDADAHRHCVEKVFPRISETDTTDSVLKLLSEPY